MTPNKLHLMVNLKNKLMEQQCFSSLKNLKTLLLNFQKENGTLLTVNQRVTICTKAQSNFEQVH